MSESNPLNTRLDTKIDPEIKAKWVTALRSGKYIQDRFALKRANGCYCVIGVLCELYRLEHPSRARWTDDVFCVKHNDGKTVERNQVFTPLTVDQWAGWDSCYIRQEPELRSSRRFLSEMNDYKGWTFEQLADYIEENM